MTSSTYVMVETRRTKMSTEGHLNVYYQNKRIREYLIKAGLINRHGDILPQLPTSLPVTRPVRRKSKRSPLRQSKSAVTIESSEKEKEKPKIDQEETKETNDETTGTRGHKLTRARRDRSIPLYQPEKSKSIDLLTGKPIEKYNDGTNLGKTTLPRPVSGPTSKTEERCRVIMIYHGSTRRSRMLKNRHETRPDEIVVLQQHCGGENLTVFKDFVYPSQKFCFDSRRHPEYPFGLAFYINGLIDSRISVCCEYRHRQCVRLGSKSGAFAICEIQRVKPCQRCKSEKYDKRAFARRSLYSDPDRYHQSVFAPFGSSDQQGSPSHEESSRVHFVQRLLGETSPPITRPSTPTAEVEPTTTHPPVESEAEIDPISSLTSTLSKDSKKQTYYSDFDDDDPDDNDSKPSKPIEPKPMMPDKIDDSSSESSTARKFEKLDIDRKSTSPTQRPDSPLIRKTIPTENISRSESPVQRTDSPDVTQPMRKEPVYRPGSPEMTAPTVVETTMKNKSSVHKKSSDWSNGSFFDIDSEPTTRSKHLSDEDDDDDDDDFFKTFGPPRRGPINDDFEDMFRTKATVGSGK